MNRKITKIKTNTLFKKRKYTNGLIIDFGCGNNKQKKAIGVDIYKRHGVDIIWDITKSPYPFPSNSAQKIYLIQVLEHFSLKKQIAIIKEIQRILKPGGILDLRVPHAFSVGAFQDPTHKAFFTFHTIDYFLKGSAGYEWYPKTKFNFKLIERRTKAFLSYSRHLQNKNWRLIETIPTFLLGKILSISPGLADIYLKFLPFYYVDIIYILKKR